MLPTPVITKAGISGPPKSMLCDFYLFSLNKTFHSDIIVHCCSDGPGAL